MTPALRRAVVARHKRRQLNGLSCESGCPHHRKTPTEPVWARHTGWTFMYVANVDQMAAEGAFD